jgi:hypothetical protein
MPDLPYLILPPLAPSIVTTNGTSERLQELIDGIAGNLDRLAAALTDLDEAGRSRAIGRLSRVLALLEGAVAEAERRVLR